MSDTKLLAKDLRIGNLILKLYTRNHRSPKIHKVTSIDFRRIEIGHEYFEFEPIPLSEDVLIKLGAEKKSTTEFRIGNRLLIYRKFSWWDYGADVELPYTHTLQNFIHSLTGEELVYTEN